MIANSAYDGHSHEHHGILEHGHTHTVFFGSNDDDEYHATQMNEQ